MLFEYQIIERIPKEQTRFKGFVTATGFDAAAEKVCTMYQKDLNPDDICRISATEIGNHKRINSNRFEIYGALGWVHPYINIKNIMGIAPN